MLKLDTKNYKPICVEIDGQVYEVRKITNRVIARGVEISNEMQAENISMADAYRLLVDFLMLYLPLDRDWIMDNLSPQDCRVLMDNLRTEMDKAMGETEPPLASGPDGDSSPK
jgi:hypothetical protein